MEKKGFVNILLTHAGLVDLLNLRSRGKQTYDVIIWIEEKSGNALIWCDDHGQLAYFVAAECTSGPKDFSVGDLVKFVEGYQGKVRRAYDVVVANPAQYTSLKITCCIMRVLSLTKYMCHRNSLKQRTET